MVNADAEGVLLRLECLKLASRPNLGPQEITAIADHFVAWCHGDQPGTRVSGSENKVAKQRLR